MPVTRHRGFTLIELMVSLVLGLVVIGGVMGVFISTYQANAHNIKAIRLNEEMRAVMSMITRDVRRAGGRGFAWNSTNWNSTTSVIWYATNSFSTAIPANWTISRYDTNAPINSCIRIAYDLDGDKFVTDDERFGYRLRKNANNQQVIEAYMHTVGKSNCENTDALAWQGVTDPEIAWIQSLVFTATTEPGVTGVAVRTVTVNLRAATHTRSTDPSTQAANCSDIDVVCQHIVEKIRVRNDAVL